MGLIDRWLKLLRDPAQAALPTAREEHRGMLRILSGDGASTRDKLYLGRDSSGTKAWVEIVNDTDAQTLAGKTLTTPTIASFVNAQHNHSNAAGGGTVSHLSLSNIGANSHAAIDSFMSDVAATTFITRTPSGVIGSEFALSSLAAGLLTTDGSGNVGRVAAPTGTVVGTSDSQTLTNKTLTTPTLNDAILGNAIETTGTTPGVTALAAAGSTATVSVTGNDTCGIVEVVPGGAGIVAGAVITLTFAAARPDVNFAVLLTPASTAARSLSPSPGVTSRTTTTFNIATQTALTSGSSYQWFYFCCEY